MKTVKFFFIVIFVNLLLSACGSSSKITYDYDDAIDFSLYKTFILSQHTALNLKPLDSARFVNAFANALGDKGIVSTKKGALIINILRQEKEAQSNSQIGVGVGQHTRNVGINIGGVIPIPRHATTQTITLDFRDANSRKLIWQSHAKNTYRNVLTPIEKEKMYFDFFTEILKGYPPIKSKK